MNDQPRISSSSPRSPDFQDGLIKLPGLPGKEIVLPIAKLKSK